MCGDQCVAVATDATNCGACGNSCGADSFCLNGMCMMRDCAEGLTRCGDLCVDLMTSVLHCGSCNVSCPECSWCRQGSCEVVEGLALTEGRYQYGPFAGQVSIVSYGASLIDQANGCLCVSGEVANETTGGPQPALVVWNLNQPEPGSEPQPADLSTATRITVSLANRRPVAPLRLELQVLDSMGVETSYCVPLPAEGKTAKLDEFTTECWSTEGIPFDPATMRPTSLRLHVASSLEAAHPFDFCVTRLELE